MNKRIPVSLIACSLGVAIATTAAQAYELGGVAIHGSLSSTAAYSDKYNFLGSTADSLDFIQNEATVNATKRFDSGLKIAGQIYAYRISDFSEVTLDFGNVDYSFTQEFGVRLGRNKTPIGLYNEVQDLDQVRIFASLPLNFYPRAYRAFAVSTDGISVYGNVGANKAGSFDYQMFCGYVGPVADQQPTMISSNLRELTPKILAGGSLVWNAPVDGLRLGYSYYQSYGSTLATNTIAIPGLGSTGFAGDFDYSAHVGSIEYTRGKWSAVTEYKHTRSIANMVNEQPLAGGFVPAGSIANSSDVTKDEVYFQLTYQATEKVGLGAYYAYSDFKNSTIDKDTALATSYAITPWWLIKGEVHFMDGIHELGTAGDNNPGATDEKWTYYVVKTTISF
jgi:hypothetical protein